MVQQFAQLVCLRLTEEPKWPKSVWLCVCNRLLPVHGVQFNINNWALEAVLLFRPHSGLHCMSTVRLSFHIQQLVLAMCVRPHTWL